MATTTEATANHPATTHEEVHDCPVDPDGDLEDPNNLFTCKVSEECCTVDLAPACCSSKDTSEEIMDQVKLWVPLLAIILVLAIFIWWCRSDESCCDVEKPCLYRFGCKKYKDEDEDEEETIGSQVSLRSQKSSTTLLVNDDGQGHDAADLELAADNLEAELDQEEGEDCEEGEEGEEGDEEPKEEGEEEEKEEGDEEPKEEGEEENAEDKPEEETPAEDCDPKPEEATE